MPVPGNVVRAVRAAVECCRGQHLLVAVSGGPDSVALLRVLHELRDECRLSLTAGHFNHRFRGTASDQDADWVTELASKLNLPIVTGAADVTASEFTEAAARSTRYEFLSKAAAETGATRIVTGHTSNDQIETVLHHLLRGTGLRGLTGIPRERSLGEVTLFRPLLDVSHAGVLEYLSDRGQGFREDATNLDQRWTRNWLRKELLPLIESRFPHAGEAIGRLAQQATETLELAGREVTELLEKSITRDEPDAVEVQTESLTGQPASLLRLLFVELWIRKGWPRREMSAARWNELAQLVGQKSGAITCPGRIEARRIRGTLVIRRLSAASTGDSGADL